jgi:hypothetical protein
MLSDAGTDEKNSGEAFSCLEFFFGCGENQISRHEKIARIKGDKSTEIRWYQLSPPRDAGKLTGPEAVRPYTPKFR